MPEDAEKTEGGVGRRCPPRLPVTNGTNTDAEETGCGLPIEPGEDTGIAELLARNQTPAWPVPSR
jgi:hypothetical protein